MCAELSFLIKDPKASLSIPANHVWQQCEAHCEKLQHTIGLTFFLIFFHVFKPTQNYHTQQVLKNYFVW